MSRQKRGFYYGWIIVATCFLVGAIASGSAFSFGVFLTPFRESFGWSTTTISVAYSLCLLLYTSLAPLAGWSVDRYGPKITTMVGGLFQVAGLLLIREVKAPWQLYATYGLIGIGMSAAFSPLMTTVSRWFTQRRGLVVGIVSAGMGTGPLIVAPLARYLISAYDWRFAFLVLGLAAGLMFPAALLLRRNPPQKVPAPHQTRSTGNPHPATKVTAPAASGDFSLRQALRTRAFWLIAMMYLLVGIGLQMINAHIVAYSEVKGLPPMTAAIVLSAISGASIPGRIISGMISDRIGRKSTLAACVFLESMMILGLMRASSVGPLFLLAAAFGLGYGGHATQFPALIGEMLGLSHMGAILGAAVFFWGIGGALGPILAGRVFDLTGDYSSAFIIGAIAMLLAVAASFFLKSPQRKE